MFRGDVGGGITGSNGGAGERQREAGKGHLHVGLVLV